jgi:hypothetical protein
MSGRAAAEWLASTQWSIALHESQYAYAIVESIHVWTLCLFVGFAVLLDLRLLGIVFRGVPISDMTARLLPWTRLGFVVMVLSGVLLFYAIPVRTFHNVFFRTKAVLLILAGLNAFVFHKGIYRTLSEWDAALPTPPSARRAAMMSLMLWAAIVFSGRFIAYNWFDCGRPQSSVINLVAGCSPADIDPYR